MRELIDEFIYKSYRDALNSNRIDELENIVEKNKKRLKENLSKRRRKLLLRMGDAKDLITEECSYECYVAGFKMGLKVGYEVNKE